MMVTVYTRDNCEECERVLQVLAPLAGREGFELLEAQTPEGAPAPCVRFEAPGAPFYNAQGLTESRFLEYLDAATRSTEETKRGSKSSRGKGKSGGLPTADYEATHPVRSYLWRHRVGGIISALSLFVGVAWIAPLTPSWGWGNGFYNAVHSVYRLVCDEVPARSAQVGGLPVCLCWRCTAIYLGSLVFGTMFAVGRDRDIPWLGWLTRPASLALMLIYGLPLILDGATHALGLRPGLALAHSPDFWLSWEPLSADWWLRVTTAGIAAIGAVKFLCPRLDKVGFVYERLHNARLAGNPGAQPAQVPNAS